MSVYLRLFSGLFALFVGANAFGATISSFEPTIGSVGDQVTITGTGFDPSATLDVRFNGVRDFTAQVTAANGTIIQAQVPVGTPLGPGAISVRINNGTPVSSLTDFTVIGPGPYITGFTPTAGDAGVEITIDGLHFMSSGANGASFNGKPGVSFFVQSDISIKVNAPSGVTTGPISVRSPIGTNTTVTNFFVPPVITSFSPTNGRASTNVLIRGTNFTGTTAVSFGGIFASNINVLSNGAVTVSVPANAVTGKVRLFAPAGSFITTSNFVIQPTIFSVTPGFGPPGTPVVITGANFTNATTSIPTIKFNNVTAANPTNVSFGELTVIVPATTSGPITLTTTDGTATSPTNFYLPASITSFTPTNSPPGSIVTITGVNFTNASAVNFNGTAAVSFFVTNNTTIGAMVPPDFSTGPISVTTPAGTTNSSGLFYAPPGIILFTPTHGLPGTNVTLTGSNFLGASSVRFNGTPATFFVTNNTTIGAIVPNNAQTGPITVIAPAGSNTTAINFVLDYSSDLTVTVADAPDPVFATSNLVYTILVANTGPFAAPNVIVSNTLPGSVTLKSATTTHGTLNTNGNPVIGNLGQLNNGALATLTLTVSPQIAAAITNFVTVQSDFNDPALSNNTAIATTTVLPLPILAIRQSSPNRVRVSWPAALSNLQLQYKETIPPSVAWTNVTTPPSSVSGENFVIETNNTPTRFYRLRN